MKELRAFSAWLVLLPGLAAAAEPVDFARDGVQQFGWNSNVARNRLDHLVDFCSQTIGLRRD